MLNRLLAYNPNLKQSWILIVILALCLLIIGGVMAVIMDGIAPEWASLAGTVLGYIIVALIVLGKGVSYEPVAPPRQSPLLWLLLVPFTLSLGLAIQPLSAWIPMPDVMKQLFEELLQKSLPAFLMVVVVAPVCEEWLLRGIILKGLLTHYSPRKAIVWSAVMFAVMHLNPWQAIPAFILGLIIGWIYWRTRSLWPCIFIHAVNNAAAFIFTVFISPDTPVDATFTVAGGYYTYAAALFVCVLTGICIKNIIYDTTPDSRNPHEPVNYTEPATEPVACTEPVTCTENVIAHKGGNKIFFLVAGIFVAGVLILILGIAILARSNLNNIAVTIAPKTARQDVVDITIRIHTDAWHDVSIPMSINDLHDMGIIFDNEALEKFISQNWLNTLGAFIFFNEQMTGNMNVDIDTRDVVRIHFLGNNHITLGELELGVNSRQDIINTLGNPHSSVFSRRGGRMEYHTNNNRIVFWFDDDLFSLFHNRSKWVAVSIISMDVAPAQKPSR